MKQWIIVLCIAIVIEIMLPAVFPLAAFVAIPCVLCWALTRAYGAGECTVILLLASGALLFSGYPWYRATGALLAAVIIAAVARHFVTIEHMRPFARALVALVFLSLYFALLHPHIFAELPLVSLWTLYGETSIIVYTLCLLSPKNTTSIVSPMTI